MRIMLSGEHCYPSQDGVSSGPHPRAFSSGSGHLIHDLLAKGLAEAGHDVLYQLAGGAKQPLPPGVTLISKPDPSADIYHNGSSGFYDATAIAYMESHGVPVVTTCHLDRLKQPAKGWHPGPNWIYVSKTLARAHGSTRYVLNGLDPADYVYSESKSDYLLFLSPLERAWDKGLDIAFEISKRTGIRLVVAGTAGAYDLIHSVELACKENGAEYVGDVRGKEKADLYAGAKAFLFPTKLNEAFGLVLVEAMLSGTPVICSMNGACPEIVSPEAGFLCRELGDYISAVERLQEIKPSACRAFAMERYHYRSMAAGYVKEYEAEISASSNGKARARTGP